MTPRFVARSMRATVPLMNTAAAAPAALAPAVAALEAAGFRAIEIDALGVTVDLTRAGEALREYAVRVATEAGAVLVDMGVGGLFLIEAAEDLELEAPAEVAPAARVIQMGTDKGRGTVVELKRSFGLDLAAVKWDERTCVDWVAVADLTVTTPAPPVEAAPARRRAA